MKSKVGFLLILGMVLYSDAHFLSNIWPQKKTESKEVGNPNANRKVLIGGVSSRFKDEIIKAVTDSLQSDSVYVKAIEIQQLRNENPEKWSAVFILNTCMGWEIDNRVSNYLKSYSNYYSFIVLTTSGDPDSCGESAKLPKNINAISSASNDAKKDEVVNKVLKLIRNKIKE